MTTDGAKAVIKALDSSKSSVLREVILEVTVLSFCYIPYILYLEIAHVLNHDYLNFVKIIISI